MTRPLRITVAGGWYHLTARGQNRQRIFDDVRDRENFLARLEAMSGRYGVEVHAYVLMPNHYHLVLRTPQANASQAMQWLNNGYGIWRNRRHGLTGHVFQGRFKSVLIEGGEWLLELSLYVHFNPIAVKALGLGKREKKAENSGRAVPTAELLEKRLETLRTFRWSSYGAYAGYTPPQAWLHTDEILTRVPSGREGYRKAAESRMTGGNSESLWSQARWGVVLGSAAFADKMRQLSHVARETCGRGELYRQARWDDIVSAVERVKGEPWSSFVERHADWGRDLALWVASRRCGMRLRELGECAGGMDYSAVSEAIRSFERVRMRTDAVRDACSRILQILNLDGVLPKSSALSNKGKTSSLSSQPGATTP
jgi:REP element-mobilizing transposase RayT